MRRILMVEDNPGDVMLVQEAIRLSSFQVHMLTACDGEQALEMLLGLTDPLDCILLDLNLPKLDGLTLLESHRDKFRAPVVSWTGSENPDDKRRALELGAHDFVIKPVDFDVFVKTVQDLVERFTLQLAGRQSLN